VTHHRSDYPGVPGLTLISHAQQCVANLRRVHSRQDYARMAEPILLEVQQREQEILEYLSGALEPPLAG